ncbi:hypothetical protein ACFP2T_16410 [Plantactinospora solaniradicis]|uniref:Uncharacterized protein n=1 Tax=Plantactinospora solaniradicis TaxID=1723736 RepID=A0ABW1K7T7_9ACTN
MAHQTATPRHPSVLHALAAAWSLRQAWQYLSVAVAREAHAVAAEADAFSAADGIRSSQWGAGRSGGSHGDPTGNAVLSRVRSAGQSRPLAALAKSTTDTLTWLADTLGLAAGPDPMWRITNDLPRLQPGTAEQLRRWLADHDTRIRTTLGIDPDEHLLQGAECPACHRRPLYARTAAPDPADWVVTCGTGCLCSGQGCGCGMLVQVEGAVHIWDRSVPTVAAMLGALDGQRTEGVAA